MAQINFLFFGTVLRFKDRSAEQVHNDQLSCLTAQFYSYFSLARIGIDNDFTCVEYIKTRNNHSTAGRSIATTVLRNYNSVTTAAGSSIALTCFAADVNI